MPTLRLIDDIDEELSSALQAQQQKQPHEHGTTATMAAATTTMATVASNESSTNISNKRSSVRGSEKENVSNVTLDNDDGEATASKKQKNDTILPSDMKVTVYEKNKNGKSMMMQRYIKIIVQKEFTLSMLSGRILIRSEKEICDEFVYKAEYEGLLGVEYDQPHGRVSSGYDPETRNILESMKTCNWKEFFRYIEKECKLTMTKCWVVRYDERGFHKYHRDKLMNTHRWIISLCCMGKEFWLKCKDGEVRHKLRHGSVVVMNKKTSGNLKRSDWRHSGKGDAGRSWAVIFETKPM